MTLRLHIAFLRKGRDCQELSAADDNFVRCNSKRVDIILILLANYRYIILLQFDFSCIVAILLYFMDLNGAGRASPGLDTGDAGHFHVIPVAASLR